MVLVRAPLGALPIPIEPYAGVGFGVFFSSLSSPQSTFSSNSTSVGFVSQVGARYRVTSNWSGFVEWKYNRTTLSHDNLAGSGLNVEGTYSAHLIAVGIGYHF